ncbi:MAG: hypothetical protein GY715_03545 [Planctomycetes bacterium]|nr:hypothetical protein [Planctomycetota bacterium]
MRTFRSGLVILIACLACLAFTGRAPAQVDHGVVADPISRKDLDRYAATLELSEQQQRELHRMHEEYLDTHQALRDGAIAEFINEHTHFGGATSEISDDVESEQEIVRDLRKMNGSLRSLDGRFFDQVAAVLSEEQLERLPWVRAARERARHLQGPAQTSYHPALDVDLSLVYADLADEIATDVRAETDARVDTYERALARAARAMHEHALAYRLAMAEQLRMQRAEADAADDPDAPQHGDFTARATIIRDAQTNLAAKAALIGDLQRRLYTALLPLLDEAQQDALRKRFFNALYRRISADRGPASKEIARILGRDDLPPRLASEVKAERLAYRDATDRVLNKMLDNADARRRSNASHTLKMMLGADDPYVYDDPAEFDVLQRRLDRRLARVNRETVDRLQALLDEHLPGRLALERPADPDGVDPTLGRGLHSSVSVADGIVTYDYKHIPLDQLVEQFGAGRHALRPISKRRLMQWMRQLDIAESDEVIADVLHDDYLDRFDVLDDTGALAALRVARASLFVVGPDRRPIVPTEDCIRALFQQERSAARAVRALDAWFFQQIAVGLGDALPAEARQRLERARSREMFLAVAAPKPHGLFVFGNNRLREVGEGERASVDLTQLVGDLDLPDDLAAEIDPLLLEYETTATTAFQEAFDAVRRFDEHRALIMSRHLRWDEEDGLVAKGMRVDDEMTGSGTRLVDVMRHIVALNRGSRDAIDAALPSPYREQFASAYKHAGWPDVYLDEQALHGALETALAMEDLSSAQRDAVVEISLAYRRDHDAYCDRIIEAAGDWQQRRRNRSERSELNARTRRKLSELLTPEQAQRVAGLVDTSEGP